MTPKVESVDPAFAAQFRKIQQTFVAGLAQRLHDIQHALDAQARHMALHRLAGAAGSYGFGELSLLAREAMEVECAAPERLQAVLQRLAAAVAELVQPD
ncbi:Hpt domain-containing protein [Rhodoferax sp.]|uniref:Hpt domain-containing protein n=1 Tax=Rhodoferax sp. TaxID=50421 RepID=UPI0025CEB6E2|nr:Hpt domain-containing protein [Rhodoferax sp.]